MDGAALTVWKEASAYAATHLLPPAGDQRDHRAPALGGWHRLVGGGPGGGPGAPAAPAPAGVGGPPPRLHRAPRTRQPRAVCGRLAVASTLAAVPGLSPSDGLRGHRNDGAGGRQCDHDDRRL